MFNFGKLFQNLIGTMNNEVIYKKFDDRLTIKDDLYNESSGKKYYYERKFLGIVSHNVRPEQIKAMGAEQLQIDIVITLTYEEAKEKEILNSLLDQTIENDLIVYNGEEYRINKIFNDTYVGNKPIVINLIGERVHA